MKPQKLWKIVLWGAGRRRWMWWRLGKGEGGRKSGVLPRKGDGAPERAWRIQCTMRARIIRGLKLKFSTLLVWTPKNLGLKIVIFSSFDDNRQFSFDMLLSSDLIGIKLDFRSVKILYRYTARPGGEIWLVLYLENIWRCSYTTQSHNAFPLLPVREFLALFVDFWM